MLEIQAIQKSASTTNGHVVSDPVFCVIPASKDLDTLAGLYKKELEAAAGLQHRSDSPDPYSPGI